MHDDGLGLSGGDRPGCEDCDRFGSGGGNGLRCGSCQVAGVDSDPTVSIDLYAGAEVASHVAIATDSTLSMAIDSARLETLSLDVGAAADSDGVPALGSDLAAAFASGRTVVFNSDGAAVMD